MHYDEQGNPLSEFGFEGVVKNSPDVERVTSSDLAEYKVDGWGTEEIVSASESCAPTLTIRYPDGSIETDARFMYRKTADGTKLDMGGKVISWNQLLENGNFADTNGWSDIGSSASLSVSDNVATITKKVNALSIGGVLYRSIANLSTSHKYYLSCIARTLANTHTLTIGFYNTNGTEGGNAMNSTNSTSYTKLSSITSPKSNANVLALRCGISSSAAGVQANVHSCMCIDLTAIYGSGKEPTSVEAFESDYRMWFGKPLSYEEYDAGSQRQTFAPQNAFITNLKGETVAWNQLIYNGNFANGLTAWTNYGTGSTVSVENGKLKVVPASNNQGANYYYNFNTPLGHKMYYDFKVISPTTGTLLLYKNSNNISEFPLIVGEKRIQSILTVGSGYAGTHINFLFRFPIAGETYYLYDVRAFDLTLIYGSGNEPTTAAAFEADYIKWFGKPLGFETYDTGSLKPVKMLSMKTVGFNAADYDEMKVGSDNYAYSYNGYYCKSFKLLPNTTYRIRKKASSYGSVVLLINSDSAINSGNYYDTRSSSSFSKDYTTNSSGLLYVGVVSGTSAQVKARLEEIDLQI